VAVRSAADGGVPFFATERSRRSLPGLPERQPITLRSTSCNQRVASGCDRSTAATPRRRSQTHTPQLADAYMVRIARASNWIESVMGGRRDA
jgi:hypothetical protein